MWPEFIPIEFRGMSIITAMFVLAIAIAIMYLNDRIRGLHECVNNTRDTLKNIQISIARIEAYSKTHYEDIKELKELLRK